MDNFEEKKIDKIVDFKLLKRLNKYTKPFYWILLISILAVFLSSVADLLRPYLTKVIIDDYVTGYKTEMFVSDQPFDSDYNIEFESKHYIRDKYYDKLQVKPGYSGSKQLLKTKDQYYLVDGFIAENIGYNDFEIKTSNDSFKLTIKNDSKLYGSENIYTGTLLTHDAYKIFREHDVDGIINITMILFLTLILAFVFTYIQVISLNYVGQKVIYNMRKDLFDHIQHLSMSYYEKNPIGRLVTRVTNDMNNISEMYTDVIISFLKDFIILIGTMIIMVRMDWRLSLLCFSTLPIVIFVSFLFRKYIRAAQRMIKIKIAEINATLSENISGMKIIQLFNKEKHMGDTFDEVNTDHLNAWLKEVNIYAIFRPSMNLIYSLTLVLLIYFGGQNIVQNQGNELIQGAVGLGVMVAFITYIQNYFRPIFDLSEKFNIMQAAMASIERVLMILDDKEQIVNEPTVKLDNPFEGEIEFEHVNFSYNKGEPILKDVSFKINAGETVAIVGATGSGKTTITSLIGRFYDIQSGCIKIDGHAIKDMDLTFLRSQVAVVLQDVFLFAGSIRDNITLGENMSDKEVKEVATFVNASHFVDKLEGTYDYILTEKGSTLSAGQRQLLSFARALAFDPSILILDEATSNIDTETELLIQDAITKLIRNRTTIIIAHRLSTIQHANKIIVMHKGEICEMGTHQELLEKKGRYYDLYLLQYQEEQAS